ncbi:ABC-F family ATP-binding cassette domain-containing protein [uncultured Clostridium sp.]|uniref:ABC-F family ATP-binding cassette domain-containing protein n=1 Tax=uncultured Clostridium sp. TaxID=59620 RepID=UPI00258AD879|nr:ABC-F family ATP-binding cassette domain-containing protein [uncultured Clostridium sp.]MDU1348824.1 ABC-F family ATP-binding cassette domain-containing protein [Clostridium argentinense]
MIVLSCNNIHKSFGIDVILKNISFNINEGEKVGLIGANGAGKSTLFKILTSQMEHDGGELFIDKSKKVGYLSQNLALESDNTIYDELLLVFENLLNMERKLSILEEKMNEPYDASKEDYHNKIIKDYTTLTELYTNNGGYTYKGEISRVLKGLGFTEADFDKSINILSGGQKTRVALCKLLLTKPDILLLDEPTNHLDLDAIEWLEEYLKAYKGSIIIISHDRFFLDAVTTKTLELIGGMVEIYNGNYSTFIDLKKKNYEVALKAYSLQQAEIKRQEEIIARYKSFNREKSIRAAESRQKALDKMDKIEAPIKDKKASKIEFQTEIKSGNDVLYIENLSKSFGERMLFTNVNMDIKRESKIALIGDNGRGKTTLFKIIMDEIPSDSGIKVLGKNVNLGYYDQEQSNLNEEKTILDEVWDDFPKMTTTEIRGALAAFLFTGDDVFKKIKTLSGGEKCRINLLKLMLSKCNFLLLDEPTNHLDIVSREALEDAILTYDGTVLVISHDRYFLNKVVNKIFELKEDGIKEYLGNYSYYVDKKKNPLRFETEEEYEGITKTQIKLDRKKKKEQEKLEREKKNYIKSLEDKISTLEGDLEELQNQLCIEEVYSNPEESQRVNKEITNIETKLELLYEEWENHI